MHGRQPGIGQAMTENGWVQLAVLSTRTTARSRCSATGSSSRTTRRRPQLPTAASSADWYRGWRDHLEFAEIGTARTGGGQCLTSLNSPRSSASLPSSRPWCSSGVLGLPSLRRAAAVASGRPTAACRSPIVLGLVATLAVFGLMLVTGDRHVVVDLGNWVSSPARTRSVATATTTSRSSSCSTGCRCRSRSCRSSLCGTIGAFADAVPAPRAGVQPVLRAVRGVPGRDGDGGAGRTPSRRCSSGGSWSGCRARCWSRSSTSGRPRPRNGLRVWVVYRVSDAALLLAAVVLHHLTGEGDFDRLMGDEAVAARAGGRDRVAGAGRRAAAAGGGGREVGAGAVLRLAAAGDGRADARRSAVFYGALSVHLGAFLLLRVSPLHRRVGVAGGGGRRARAGDGGVRVPGRDGADGHQERAVVRVAGAGRDHRRRDRAGALGAVPVVRRAGPPARATPACGRSSSSAPRRCCRTTATWRTRSAAGCRARPARWPRRRRGSARGCTGSRWSAATSTPS